MAYRMSAIRMENIRDSYIGNLLPFPYNELGQVSLDKLKGEGAENMIKLMKSKGIMAAALALMLLLSACGTTAPVDNGETTSTPTSEVTEPVEEGTRTVSTVMGDVEVPVNP